MTDLTGAIDDQNSAIAKLGADTLAKQQAATIAVEAATARGKVSEGYAARIDREPAVKGGPVCRSGAAVLDAAKAGELLFRHSRKTGPRGSAASQKSE